MVKNLKSGGSPKASKEEIKEELHSYVNILAAELEGIDDTANLLTL